MNELLLDSLQRRMQAMHSLYFDAIDSMSVDQVNHFEREGVVPIAFCLFHLDIVESPVSSRVALRSRPAVR